MKYVFLIMKKQKFGRIINILFVNGLVGFVGKFVYNSVKYGVIGLIKVGVLEGVFYGIIVNVFCLGYVDIKFVCNQLSDFLKMRNVFYDFVFEQVIFLFVL